MMPLEYVLALSALIFGLGLYGALVLKNAIRILMCIELMLNAVNLNLIAFSRYLNGGDPRGQIFTVFVMTLAAAEAAIGLAIILVIANKRDHIDVDKVDMLKW